VHLDPCFWHLGTPFSLLVAKKCTWILEKASEQDAPLVKLKSKLIETNQAIFLVYKDASLKTAAAKKKLR